jgi:5-formyltetrahydrofolate cyclo-ligase
MDKQQLRRELLHQRRQLSPLQWQSQSLQICENLRRLPSLQRAKTIGAYFSTQNEPDLSSLWPLPKRWGFPRCVEKNLLWHPWQYGESLTTGAYGIAIPRDQTKILEPSDVDLLLIPCVAGDRQGYRLGYGGGYYDRLLTDPAWQTIPRLGVIFEAGLREKLSHDGWDIPLQGMVTEKELFWLDNG